MFREGYPPASLWLVMLSGGRAGRLSVRGTFSPPPPWPRDREPDGPGLRLRRPASRADVAVLRSPAVGQRYSSQTVQVSRQFVAVTRRSQKTITNAGHRRPADTGPVDDPVETASSGQPVTLHGAYVRSEGYHPAWYAAKRLWRADRRSVRDLSRQELAERASITREYMQRLEAGR